MKTIFYFLIGFALIACNTKNENENINTDLINNPATATNEVDTENVPIIEFETEVIDFGTITQGEIVEKVFRFKNIGKSNLLISSARGSCGCTVPEWPKEPIAPGEENIIKVKFDSNGKQGKQHKTVTLVCNTIPNTKVIALKGEVKVPGTENE